MADPHEESEPLMADGGHTGERARTQDAKHRGRRVVFASAPPLEGEFGDNNNNENVTGESNSQLEAGSVVIREPREGQYDGKAAFGENFLPMTLYLLCAETRRENEVFVRVPWDKKVGDRFLIETSNGERFAVTVPEGTGPGTTIRVELPMGARINAVPVSEPYNHDRDDIVNARKTAMPNNTCGIKIRKKSPIFVWKRERSTLFLMTHIAIYSNSTMLPYDISPTPPPSRPLARRDLCVLQQHRSFLLPRLHMLVLSICENSEQRDPLPAEHIRVARISVLGKLVFIFMRLDHDLSWPCVR
eukprot:jgi/Bigna1/75709/fgenesh1_pg.36_\